MIVDQDIQDTTPVDQSSHGYSVGVQECAVDGEQEY